MSVPFYEDTVEVIWHAQRQLLYVVCKRLSEVNLGLDGPSQFKILKDSDLFADDLFYCDITIEGLGLREMVCLPLDDVPLWLASIQSKRVRPELRAKLVRYQKECREVLARHFGLTASQMGAEPVGSTLDIIEGMTKSQMLLIQEVRRTQRIAAIR